MTSFTKLDETQQPHIYVNPKNKLNKINDNIYGGFTEYEQLKHLKSADHLHLF